MKRMFGFRWALAVAMLALLMTGTANAALTDGLVSFWTMNEGSGVTAYDGVKAVNSPLNNSWYAGIISNAFNASTTGTNYFMLLDKTASNYSFMQMTRNFTISYWWFVTNNSSLQVIWDNSGSGASLGTGIYHNFQGNKFSTKTTNVDVDSSIFSMPQGYWYNVVVRLNGTSVAYVVNGVGQGDGAFGGIGGTPSTVDMTLARGTFGGAAYGVASGLFDEIGIWNRPLSDAEIQSVYNGGAGWTYDTIGSVTLNSPVDGYHDSAFTANYTPTWSAFEFKNCSLYANSTFSGMNATALTSTSYNYITNNTLQGDGYYVWFVSCTTNASALVNSTTLGFYLDSTAPSITINTPSTVNGAYWVGGYLLRNGTFTDNLGLFNCTQEIYFPNGTLFDGNSTLCSGTSFTWANYTTPTFPVIGTYTANYSATDTHTATKNPLKVVRNDETGILFENPGKGKFKAGSVATTDKDYYSVTYTPLFDRIKWDIFVRLKNSVKNWDMTIPIESECPIYGIKGTPYAGHGVTCGAWFDFADAAAEGWAVTLTADGTNTASVRLTQSFPSSRKEAVIDPATGGLNFGSTNVSFLVNGMTLNVYDETSLAAIPCWGLTISNATTLSTLTCQNNTYTTNSTAFPTGSISLYFTATGYTPRYYYATYASGYPLTLDAYLLDTTTGVYSYYLVKDGNTLSGVYLAEMNFSKFIGGSWTVVQQAQTDVLGAALSFLSPFTVYQVTVEASSYNTYSLAGFNPLPQTYIIYLTSSSGGGLPFNGTSLFTVAITPYDLVIANGTNITASFNDPSGLLTNYGLRIVNSTGSSLYETHVFGDADGGSLTVNTSAISGLPDDSVTPFYAVAVFDRYGTNDTSNRTYYMWTNGTTGSAVAALVEATTEYDAQPLIILAFLILMLVLSQAARFGYGSSVVGYLVVAVFWYYNWFPTDVWEIPLLAVLGSILVLASRRYDA